MSGSVRSHSSKWDLSDEPEFAPDSKQLQSGWSSTGVAGSNSSKWSYLEGGDNLKPSMRFSRKETFSGGRGSNKDDITNNDYRVLNATMAWNADSSYSMRISPGFDKWKRRRHSQSPKNGSSSRSRSPTCSFRWDSVVNDRNRMRTGGMTQPCRDFAAGKCRRGSHCYFLHHDNQNYEDSWESNHRQYGPAPHESRDYSLGSGIPNEACIHFAEGRCKMGASCKYVHHDNSDGLSKASVDESTREREIDRRHREKSFEWCGGHGPNHNGDTPCKFFAFGNCRNGKHCRFSHDRQACRSRGPNRRLRGDGWGSNQGGDQVLDTPNLSDSVSPNGRLRDDRRGLYGNMVDVAKGWDGPEQNDLVAVSDTKKLLESKGGTMGAPELGFTAWPMGDGWDHSLDKNRVHGKPPSSSDKKEAYHWTEENAGANKCISQSTGTGIWPGDVEMSPDWDYGVGSHIEEERGQNKHGLTQAGTYLATSEHGRIQVAPGNHMLGVPVTIRPLSIEKPFTLHVQNQNFKKDGVITLTCDKSDSNKSADSHINLNFSTLLPGQGFNQNAQNVNTLRSSNCHAVGQSQVTVSIAPPIAGIVEGMQNQVSDEKKYTVEPNIMDASLSEIGSRNPLIQNMVSKEQLAQLTNLTASLVHIFGMRQRLPQLYAALNSHDAKDIPFLGKTERSSKPLPTTFLKPDSAVGFQMQYDSICDSIKPKDADATGVLSAFSPIKKIAEVEIPSGRQNFDDSCKIACSEELLVKNGHLIRLQPGQNIEINKENNEVVALESKNSRDDHIITQENDPLEILDQNGPDEAKKIKDVKGIRAFKFALVEFIKELLKPTWKEGQITKEDYKAIVKKVADKVTGTMRGAHIPQTQEKIDHYLSCSKPKLNKLVQAYVEKIQKT